MKTKLCTLLAILYGSSNLFGQTVVNVQTPNSPIANHANSSPKDFSINANGLNPTYLWSENSNLLQGLAINLSTVGDGQFYMQRNNGRLQFFHGGDLSTKVEVNYDNAGWSVVSNTSKIHHGWFVPAFSGSNSIGKHNLKVKIFLVNSVITREYTVNITEDCSHFFTDNFGNTITVWGHSPNDIPIVLADGIDQTNTDFAELINFEANNLATELLNNNYSLWVLNCAKGGQDIESNAAMFASAIRFVSDKENKDIIAAGISMGGQVSRWAICEAEGNNRDLPITHWISFDSPHTEAVIDHELQQYIFDNQPNNISLNATASKQMLDFCPFDVNGSVRNDYLNKRNALNNGNYPQNCETIGVSFSNGLANPNLNQTWLQVDVNGLPNKSGTFKVKNKWAVGGSYLPKLTGSSATEFIGVPWLNFSITSATTTRSASAHPTFVPFESALDMVNGESRFCYTLFSEDNFNFAHHDQVPQDIIIKLRKLISLPVITDIATGITHNFANNEQNSAKNGFNVFGKMYINGDIASGRTGNLGALPVSNSLFRFSTSCETDKIIIKNGGELNIGAYNRGLAGELMVRNSTTLELEAGSKLIINDNSLLKFNQNAKLIIHPGASIILNGPNAMLHINGHLVLEPNANFAPQAGTLGFGKVVLENNWGELYIESKQNNKFIIDAGRSNAMNMTNVGGDYNLETRGGYGAHIGWGSLFEVKNARVLINDKSQITTETFATNFENVFVGATNTAAEGDEENYPRNINIINSSASFKNVKVQDLETGLVFKCLNNWKVLRLDNFNVFNCAVGVKNEGGVIIANNSKFDWNHRQGDNGVEIIGAYNGNRFNLCTFSNRLSGTAGRYVWHASELNNAKTNLNILSKSGVQLINNKLMDAERSIFSTDATLNLKCNKFETWYYNPARGHNLELRTNNGQLFLDRNSLGISFSKHIASYNTFINMDGGRNYFHGKNYEYFNMILPAKQALTDQSFDYTLPGGAANINCLKATNNDWGTQSVVDFRPAMPMPTNSNLFIVKNPSYPVGTNTYYDLGYSPFLTITGSTYEQFRTNSCSVPDVIPEWIGKLPDKMLTNLDVYSQYVLANIPQTISPSVDLGTALERTVNNFNTAQNLDYSTSLNEMIYLTKVALPDSEFDVSYYMYNTTHDVYYASLFDTAITDSVRSIRNITFGTQMLTMQDYLLNQASLEATNFKDMQYELKRDKALLLRSLNRRPEGIVILNQLMLDPAMFPSQVTAAQAWQCVLSHEQMVLDSVISIREMNLSICLPVEELEIAPDSSQSSSMQLSSITNINTNKDYTLYPNPANQGFYFESKLALECAKLSITDALGKTVNTPITKQPDNKLFINTAALPVGVYQVSYQTAKGAQVFKVTIVR